MDRAYLPHMVVMGDVCGLFDIELWVDRVMKDEGKKS